MHDHSKCHPCYDLITFCINICYRFFQDYCMCFASSRLYHILDLQVKNVKLIRKENLTPVHRTLINDLCITEIICISQPKLVGNYLVGPNQKSQVSLHTNLFYAVCHIWYIQIVDFLLLQQTPLQSGLISAVYSFQQLLSNNCLLQYVSDLDLIIYIHHQYTSL